MAQVHWLNYGFSVYDKDGSWNAVSGLYVFARLEKDWQGTLRWRALYVGKTQDFSARLPTHEYWLAAVRLGASPARRFIYEIRPGTRSRVGRTRPKELFRKRR